MLCATAAPSADPPRRARCALARRACAAGCGRPRSPPLLALRGAQYHTYLLCHGPIPTP
jgi:hypothetical protein